MKIIGVDIRGLQKANQMFDLTGKDLLLGRLGSGKSTIINAVTISMIGYLPELGKQPGSTMELCDGSKMSVGIVADDPATDKRLLFSRDFLRKEDGSCSQINNGDDRFSAFPIMFDPLSLLTMSSDKRREFLAPFLIEKIDYAELCRLAVLSEVFGQDWLDLLEDVPTAMDKLTKTAGKKPSEFALLSKWFGKFTDLEGTLKYLNGELSADRSSHKDSESTVKALMEQKNAASSTSARLPSIKAELEGFREKKAELDKEIAASNQNAAIVERRKIKMQQLREKIANIRPQIAGLGSIDSDEAEKKQLDARLELFNAEWLAREGVAYPANPKTNEEFSNHKVIRDKLNAERETLNGESIRLLKQLETETSAKAAMPVYKCEKCGYSNADKKADDTQQKSLLIKIREASDSVSKNMEEAQFHQAEMNRIEKALGLRIDAIDKINEQLKQIANRQAERIRLASVIEETQHELDGFQKEHQEFTVVDTETSAALLAGYETSIKNLQREFDEANRMAGLIATIEQKILDEQLAALSIDLLKQSITAVKRVRNESLNKQAQRITSSANELLSHVYPAMKMDLRLEDEKGNPKFDFLFELDGKKRNMKVLSGGETALAMVAFATTIINLINPPIRILPIEGAEIDDESFEMLLRGCGTLLDMGKLDNVIVATCHTPPVIPPDWNTIRFEARHEIH